MNKDIEETIKKTFENYPYSDYFIVKDENKSTLNNSSDGISVNKNKFTFNNFDIPEITIYCNVCKHNTNHRGYFYQFTFTNTKNFPIHSPNALNLDNKKAFVFVCKNCGDDCLMICKLDQNKVEKIWQYPDRIRVEKSIQKMLSSQFSMYRKGVLAESQGFGVGAFSYYRRVIENYWKDLIEEVINICDPTKDLKIIDFLNNHKHEWRFEKLIKDGKIKVPDVLVIDGKNLLIELYNSLSRGLHASNDEECLNKAKHIRNLLEIICKTIYEIKSNKQKMNEILNNIKK